MIPILDWIFEGIVGWVSSIASQLLDAVSGLFLEALGTDMTAMEEYFPFVTKAYGVMQVTAYAILILIVIWQLFRVFGGPITEAENPWHLVVRGALFSFLIGYAKPIFTACLTIARAPYTSLMDVSMTGEDFTFAGVEQVLTNGLATLLATASVVGLILILILLIALGWNYFKLLLETVERYIVVGVLCYTSPLAFSMGASKSTNNVFKSWCRMVGSQLLLLVMNVWFLRGFASSIGQFIGNGGALTTGKGSLFLWLFCALAYLKCAQRFDSYLASMGLNVAQTGSSMGMELLMAARVITGVGSGARTAGSVFGRAGGAATATGTGAAATGFAAGFASRFNPNSYVRDAVVEGGTRMGFSGGAGFVARAFGGIAARNGATLNGQSIASVASRAPGASGIIAGDIADRSLGNYMPHMKGFQMQGTQITGGHISTTATTPEGKQAQVDMYSAAQYEKPTVPHSVVTASDGSQWYQMASGEGRGAFYDAPTFGGMAGHQGVGGVNADQHSHVPGGQVHGGGGADSHNDGADTPGADTLVHRGTGMPEGTGGFSGDAHHENGDGHLHGAADISEIPDSVPGAAGDMVPGLVGDQVHAVPGSQTGHLNDADAAVLTDTPGKPEGQASDHDSALAGHSAAVSEVGGLVSGTADPPSSLRGLQNESGAAGAIPEGAGFAHTASADGDSKIIPFDGGHTHTIPGSGLRTEGADLPDSSEAAVQSGTGGISDAAHDQIHDRQINDGSAFGDAHQIPGGHMPSEAEVNQTGAGFVSSVGFAGSHHVGVPGEMEVPALSHSVPAEGGNSSPMSPAVQAGGAIIPGADHDVVHEAGGSGSSHALLAEGGNAEHHIGATVVPGNEPGQIHEGGYTGHQIPASDGGVHAEGQTFVSDGDASYNDASSGSGSDNGQIHEAGGSAGHVQSMIADGSPSENGFEAHDGTRTQFGAAFVPGSESGGIPEGRNLGGSEMPALQNGGQYDTEAAGVGGYVSGSVSADDTIHESAAFGDIPGGYAPAQGTVYSPSDTERGVIHSADSGSENADGGVLTFGGNESDGHAAPGTDFGAYQPSGGFTAAADSHDDSNDHFDVGSDHDHQSADRFYGGSHTGGYAEAPLVAATFPSAQDGTMLRTVDDGVIEATDPGGGNTLWYNSAFFQEPDAPHHVMEAANGVQWYAMQQQAQAPHFESGDHADAYNQAVFQNFMPGYDGQVARVDGTHRQDGHFEVRNADGSGTAFYDTARYAAPRGDYQVLEDARGSQWYAIRGEAAVDRKPVYENGRAVYDDGKLRTISVETVRYRQTPARFAEPQKRADIERKPPRRKQ